MPKPKRQYPKMTEEQQRLVEENKGLVYKIVEQTYKGIYEFDDMIQVGFVGLCLSAIGFQPEKGVAFSTYAVPCIKKKIWQHHQIWVKRQKRDLTKEAYSLDERLHGGGIQYGTTHLETLLSLDNVEDKVVANCLIDVVRGIPHPKRREALLSHIKGMTLEEIGNALGVTRSRAGQLVDEARRYVRGAWGA